MCFHEKAVRSRWCLSPVLKCSVGTLRALCTIACKSKRERALFMEGTLDLPADPIYVIFKHLPWTKCHCTITETIPPVCNILALALETVRSHKTNTKNTRPVVFTSLVLYFRHIAYCLSIIFLISSINVSTSLNCLYIDAKRTYATASRFLSSFITSSPI